MRPTARLLLYGAHVWGTCVEEALRYALSTQMAHLTDADVNRLFQRGGVISSFTDKIQIGRLLELYGSAYQQELNYIRTTRNAFAHSEPGLKFESPEVEAICRVFQANRDTWGWDPDVVAPKKQFETACDFYWCYFRNQRIEVQGGPIDPRWPPFPANP